MSKKKNSLKKSHIGLVLALALAVAIGGGAPTAASAQGCAMCYQSAAASGQRSIRALRNGIVILIVPPILICIAISFLVYRRRNLHDINT
jgi:hypothetical protein